MVTLDDLATPSFMLFIAKKYSGKTYAMKYIVRRMFEQQRFDYACVISPTAIDGNSNSWGGVFPPGNILTGVDNRKKMEATIAGVIAHHRRQFNKKRLLLILDDVSAIYNKTTQPAFVKLATEARHFGITCMMSYHRYNDVCKMVRDNAEYTFIFGGNDIWSAKVLFDQFTGSNFKSWQELRKFIDKNTANHGIVCFCSYQAQNGIFLLRAPAGEKPYSVSF